MRVTLQSLIKKSFFFLIFPLFFTFFYNDKAYADFNNLNLCKESKPFEKRLNSEVKKLENRLKLYSSETKEAKALIHEIDTTKIRFENYKNANLLCGKEGLPRIIATGQWDHVNEFTIPGILFLYITGWIGWVGRKYLIYASTTDNPFENEIIINIPKAIIISTSGFLWPIEAWKEFQNKNLIASDDEITVSPR